MESSIRSTLWRPRLILSGVAVVAAILFAYRSAVPSPESMILQAYTQARPIELRLGLAPHALLRQTRGKAANSSDVPEVLLKAELAVMEGLRRHPEDAAWLQASARVHLLRGNFSDALILLQRALQQDPASLEILNDLAVTWFELAEKGAGAAERGTSADLLGQILRFHPNDRTARFNRAIVYERLRLVHEAEADWEEYLKRDAAGGWADEARQRLAQVRGYINRSSVPAAPEPWEAAVVEQLVQSVKEPNRSAPSSESVESMAARFSSTFSDDWLRDLLHTPRTLAFDAALEELRAAVTLNQRGDHTPAEQKARRAFQAFQSAANIAGAVRAQFEIVYALQRASHGETCFREGEAMRRSLSDRRYPALAAQALLEISSCASMLGDFSRADQAASLAEQIATRHGLDSLALRSLGIRASVLSDEGRWADAWDLDVSGLERYWAGHFLPLRAYQFYNDITLAAEQNGQVFLGRANSREAVRAAMASPNRSVEAMAHSKLGRLEMLAGDTNRAREEFRAADTLFASFPDRDSAANQLYEAYDEIGLARAHARLGDLAAANRNLAEVDRRLLSYSNRRVRGQYLAVTAEAARASGDRPRAEMALRQLVGLAEEALGSMPSDRDRLAWLDQLDGAYRGLVRLAIDRKETDGALEIWEWYRAGSWRSGRLAGGAQMLPESLNSVKRRAREMHNRTAIVYVDMDDGVAYWRYDDRGIEYKWLPFSRVMLTTLAERFGRQCAHRETPEDRLRGTSRQISEFLISPVVSGWSQDRMLSLELEGAAALVPFEALLHPDGSYLADKFVMYVSPGIATAASPGPRSSAQRIVLVGAPTLSPDLAEYYPPLPDALAEAREIGALFREARLLSGSDATVAALRREIGSADVFHFAGHAVSFARQSGMLFAGEPASWNANDLPPGSLTRCQLAVLSACSTGKLGSSGLADPENLARSFLAAGVHSVIASRWPVDSSATHELMILFYKELTNGKTPVPALFSASRFLRSRAMTRHPYFWSAFTVFSNT